VESLLGLSKLKLCFWDLAEGSWKRRIKADLTDASVNAQNWCENIRSKYNSNNMHENYA